LRRLRRTTPDDVKFRGESASLLCSCQRRLQAVGQSDQRHEPRPATAQWGHFLRNHDELDLGRLNKKQRETVFGAFGSDLDMQLYQRGSDAGSLPCCREIADVWNSPTV